ncbi:hypothetical protein E6H34_00725 [Candidatus Bathyarchaeota archaeon]|nr:MAG: hypothetical protein E6H34_00725 [Candidatus Bathyarchaeota archaeon]
MAIVNVRIPDDLKTRMSNLPELNWSEIVREAIESRISSERRRGRDREKIRGALKAQDRIAETLARRYSRSWKGTEVIRYWRERRYSSSTRR